MRVKGEIMTVCTLLETHMIFPEDLENMPMKYTRHHWKENFKVLVTGQDLTPQPRLTGNSNSEDPSALVTQVLGLVCNLPQPA